MTPTPRLRCAPPSPSRGRSVLGGPCGRCPFAYLFTVASELVITDTARHADIVLPATMQAEPLDLLCRETHEESIRYRRREAGLTAGWISAGSATTPWHGAVVRFAVQSVLSQAYSNNSMGEGRCATKTGRIRAECCPCHFARMAKLVDASDLKTPLSSIFLIGCVVAEPRTARVSRAFVQMAPTSLWLPGVR